MKGYQLGYLLGRASAYCPNIDAPGPDRQATDDFNVGYVDGVDSVLYPNGYPY